MVDAGSGAFDEGVGKIERSISYCAVSPVQLSMLLDRLATPCKEEKRPIRVKHIIEIHTIESTFVNPTDNTSPNT